MTKYGHALRTPNDTGHATQQNRIHSWKQASCRMVWVKKENLNVQTRPTQWRWYCRPDEMTFTHAHTHTQINPNTNCSPGWILIMQIVALVQALLNPKQLPISTTQLDKNLWRNAWTKTDRPTKTGGSAWTFSGVTKEQLFFCFDGAWVKAFKKITLNGDSGAGGWWGCAVCGCVGNGDDSNSRWWRASPGKNDSLIRLSNSISNTHTIINLTIMTAGQKRTKAVWIFSSRLRAFPGWLNRIDWSNLRN